MVESILCPYVDFSSLKSAEPSPQKGVTKFYLFFAS